MNNKTISAFMIELGQASKETMGRSGTFLEGMLFALPRRN